VHSLIRYDKGDQTTPIRLAEEAVEVADRYSARVEGQRRDVGFATILHHALLAERRDEA
jgi:hypothetical protein